MTAQASLMVASRNRAGEVHKTTRPRLNDELDRDTRTERNLF
jgi:hypothetical protein